MLKFFMRYGALACTLYMVIGGIALFVGLAINWNLFVVMQYLILGAVLAVCPLILYPILMPFFKVYRYFYSSFDAFFKKLDKVASTLDKSE